MRKHLQVDRSAQVGLSPLVMVLLVVVGGIVLLGMLLLGLCLVSLFLPAILAIAGVVFLWRSGGKPPMLYVGITLLLIGVLAYVWLG